VLLLCRFSFSPRFGTLNDAILFTCDLDKRRTVGPIPNKKLSDLIKIYRRCPSDRCFREVCLHVQPSMALKW
jgi:hypothetical protein